GELDTADTEPVSGGEQRLVDAPVVDERAVGALEVDDLEAGVRGGEAAGQPRDERGVPDEVGAGGAAHGLDGARRQSKRPRIAGLLGALENPHRRYLNNSARIQTASIASLAPAAACCSPRSVTHADSPDILPVVARRRPRPDARHLHRRISRRPEN